MSDWRPAPGQDLSLLFDVFALGQHVRGLVDAAMAGCGLTPDEYAVYSVVFEAEAITMTELSRRLGMPLTTVADYVRAMRSRGHLRRDPHPQDSRAYLLALTAGGLRAHRRASVAFTAAQQSLTAQLGPETEEAFRGMLRALSEGASRARQDLAGSRSRAAVRSPVTARAGSVRVRSRPAARPEPG
jgi:DNA-binding MarR family transcriptional regulator